MQPVVRFAVPHDLLSLVRLAQLLEHLDRQGRAADPHQYRLLADKLAGELTTHQGHPALDGLLDHLPAASAVYENLQYAHAGLCRAPLELSLSSELAVRELLARVKSA